MHEVKEYIDLRINGIKDVCTATHKALDDDRKQRGEEMIRMSEDISALARSVNGKFTAIYKGSIGILATTILSLLGILITLIITLSNH